ncbi:lipoate--protein ligase [Lactonifactor sp. BIOML-A3]|uniref:lipoate--protein ligase n=1 Tax=unclassified Lactonifactor TaxID=2636670 RepID=UPI0012B0DEA0|nr:MULTISPECIES: lipoate--protein ligase [unclassified Lactonifactor]MSA01618.1 lipoate--protein ligase [Lactonifactor sp. BIOML-A5]MSA07826.1 lipoate--protein ligase [Lactonifactor sp. BIOML-A4]MSA12443.1 lipoate--protein ligase [Lactonifactor sp. BIOML-A3]MSA17508.1 lipoate--protein ligase [Lactonifactor sp. BIOML-A2]MSA38017.1 lipoate--protein ligase [Lactonifactor sp. BIOML-A1]
MENYFIESNAYNPWYNLAVEKYLADYVQKEEVILYLWQNQNTVVIGQNQNALRECRVQLLEAEGGYLARRSTGGGAVYQDLGNLCFTFVASEERYDVEEQLKIVMKACQKYGICSHFSGRNDLLTDDNRKFSGSAFSMTSRGKVQHGTLMINVDVNKLQRYLTPTQEKLKAKGIASVSSRVCNLQELNTGLTVDGMRAALRAAFEEQYGRCTELSLDMLNNDKIQEYYKMYSSWDWRYGRSPECETVYSHRFTWGEVEVNLKLHNLIISECKVYSDTLEVQFPNMLEGLLLNQRYDIQNIQIPEFHKADEELAKQLKETIMWFSGVWR